MTNQAIARALLAALCLAQGIATMLIDLNRTHATNPNWPGHARFHLVWQTATVVWLAVLEAVLILAGGPLREQRFYLAALLTGVPMLGFFSAFIGRRIYNGTLSEPNGMQPIKIAIQGKHWRIDLNLVAELCGVVALAASIVLFRI